MGEAEIEKRLRKLDEQRRKGAEEVSHLNERLDAYEKTFELQASQVQEVVNGLARLDPLAARIGDFDAVLNKQKESIARQLRELDAWQAKVERLLEQRRTEEHTKLAQAVGELEQGQAAVAGVMKELEARREDAVKIEGGLESIRRRLDEMASEVELRGRQQSSLEEAHSQTLRRIADVEAGISDTRSRVESLRGGLGPLDDQLRRLEAKLIELRSAEAERLERQDGWTEQQQAKWVSFEREWKEREKWFGEVTERAGVVDERMLAYDETHRQMQELEGKLNKALAGLERRISELTEMYRLTEDRLRQEWAVFQADDQKRWNIYKLTSDEQWREHARLYERLSSEMEKTGGKVDQLLHAFLELQEANRQHMAALMEVLRTWSGDVFADNGKR